MHLDSYVFVVAGRKWTRAGKGASERVVVLGLLVDAGRRGIDVVEMAFEVGAGLVAGGKVVVRLEELLVLDNVGGVAVDRGVFMRANVPDGGSGTIGRSGGGKRRRGKADRDIAVELGHGALEARDHLINARRE